MRFKFIWYDMRVGFYWDKDDRILYFAPVPCCIFIFGTGLRVGDTLEWNSTDPFDDDPGLIKVLALKDGYVKYQFLDGKKNICSTHASVLLCGYSVVNTTPSV